MITLRPCVSMQDKCKRRNKSMHASQGEPCLALPTRDIQMVNEMTVWLIVQGVNLGVKT